jgi:hypothetical protein
VLGFQKVLEGPSGLAQNQVVVAQIDESVGFGFGAGEFPPQSNAFGFQAHYGLQVVQLPAKPAQRIRQQYSNRQVESELR